MTARSNPAPTHVATVPPAPARRLRPTDHAIRIVPILLVSFFLHARHHRDAVRSDLMRGATGDITRFMADSQFYDSRARRIAEGRLIDSEAFFMAPLYQYALAIPYRLFRTPLPPTPAGEPQWQYHPEPALMAQCALATLTPLFVYGLTAALAGPLAASVAGSLTAAYGFLIYYDALFMPASLIVWLHALYLWLLVVALRRDGPLAWLATGVVQALCVAAHGTALFLVPSTLACLWLVGPRIRARRFLAAGLSAAPVVALLGLTTWHNWIAAKDLVVLTSNAGLNLYVGNSPGADGTFVHRDVPYRGAVLRDYVLGFQRGPGDLPPSEISRRLASDAWRFIRDYPADELRLLGRKLRLFFNAVELGIADQFYFFKRFSYVLNWLLPSFGLIAPLGLTGLVLSVRRWRTLLPIYATLLAQLAAFLPFFILGRYRLVAVLCLIVLAGIQVADWVDAIRARNFKRVAASMAVLSLAALFVHAPLKGVFAERGFGYQYLTLASTYAEQDRTGDALRAARAGLDADFAPFNAANGRILLCYQLAALHAKRGEWEPVREAAASGARECTRADFTGVPHLDRAICGALSLWQHGPPTSAPR